MGGGRFDSYRNHSPVMNARLSHLSSPSGFDQSFHPLQLAFNRRWFRMGDAASEEWPPLARIAVTGWVIGFIGAALLYFAWPSASHAWAKWGESRPQHEVSAK